MKLSILLVCSLLAACGSDGGGSDDGGSDEDAPAGDYRKGTTLSDHTLLTKACFATVPADFATKEGDSIFARDVSFAAGDRLLVGKTAGPVTKTISVYYTNPGVTGVGQMDVPPASVSVDCSGYLPAVVALADITLFTDKSYKTTACTLTGGKVYADSEIQGQGYALSVETKKYDSNVSVKSITGTDCPPDSNLYYPLEAETIKDGTSRSTQAYHPFFQIYVAP